MKPSKTSSLGYALLGLLQQKPSSGYELRKIFSSGAMTTYSDSPGAIYPALEKLRQSGLIRGTIEKGSGLRRRQIFRLTSEGSAALKSWIALPVTQDEVIRGLDQVMLRFAFSEQVAGASVAVKLLKSLQSELIVYIPLLHEQLNAGKSTMPTSGRLALESGIKGYECLLQWTKDALATFARQPSASPQKKKGSNS